jgi:AhpD family alkylhydroperoxidase
MRTDPSTAAPGEPVANVITEPPRIDYASVFPAGARAMVGLQRAVNSAGLEPLLLELVKVRASQINGYGYCLDMPPRTLASLGIPSSVCTCSPPGEAPCYDQRERAALAWGEALTLISARPTPSTRSSRRPSRRGRWLP